MARWWLKDVSHSGAFDGTRRGMCREPVVGLLKSFGNFSLTGWELGPITIKKETFWGEASVSKR